MSGIWRTLIVIVLALLVPIVPFLALGESLDRWVAAWLEPPPPAATVALLTVAVLAADVLLPVPSSLVSTFAGAQLGVPAATAASWLGLMAGALVAFGLARACGRPLAVRLSSAQELDEIDQLGFQAGAWLLIITRPLPILAEAAVLFLGTTSMTWRRFLPPVMLSNLGIALVYAVLGRMAQSRGVLPLALGASIALPVLATTMARWLFARRRDQDTQQTQP
ncbi:MAG: VTT domain-containing protein [Pirellulales bacterium]